MGPISGIKKYKCLVISKDFTYNGALMCIVWVGNIMTVLQFFSGFTPVTNFDSGDDLLTTRNGAGRFLQVASPDRFVVRVPVLPLESV